MESTIYVEKDTDQNSQRSRFLTERLLMSLRLSAYVKELKKCWMDEKNIFFHFLKTFYDIDGV
jgi:hypothetical protein